MRFYHRFKILELLGSMRFAIALLSLIAIASIIGTVLRQNEPQVNYINQFGIFWTILFDYLGLYNVYSAWWFLLILFFLVASTSICLVRNIPKIWTDLHRWKLNIQAGNLYALHHHQAYISPLSRQLLHNKLANLLTTQNNYRIRTQQQSSHTLITARKGRANKFGYIFTHSAVIIICLGALLDSDIWLQTQLLLGHKQLLLDRAQNILIDDIPQTNRLPSTNPSFRANLFIPEGQSTRAALINIRDGTLVQDLPFTLALKQFKIDYYSTGMPKLFASDVVLTDLENGHTIATTIKVNHPLIYKGIAIYQSSFEDGGSLLKLTGYPMQGSTSSPFSLEMEVGGTSQLNHMQDHYQLELTDFRSTNVENITDASGHNDARGIVKQTNLLETYFGSGAKSTTNTALRNIGPSIQYKLRDAMGQAKEFDNYMLPVLLEGVRVFLVGVRTTPNEPFRYLRIPADEQGKLDEWVALRAALQNQYMRIQAAHRYAHHYVQQRDKTDAPIISSKLYQQIQQSALRLLELFAASSSNSRNITPLGGFNAIAAFLEQTVPAAQQARTAEIFMQILQGSLYELWQLTRAQIKLPAATQTSEHTAFLQTAINALSDNFFYGAPVLIHLDQFKEIKASVFQAHRMPGKKIVYLGCFFLVLGIFIMFYIHDNRLWILLQDRADGCHILFAGSSHRQTMDFTQTFTSMQAALQATAHATPISS